MKIKDLILKNRSYRRYFQDHQIEKEDLKELINLARLSPSARNCQPLKYILSFTKDGNDKIFPFLTWARDLKDWDGPEEGERPSAYIVMLEDKTIASNLFCDHGIAAQSILLGAVENGLGGCIIASVKKLELKKQLNISDQYRIIQVIALGKPKETIVLNDLNKDGEMKYWRDENQVHHVPKRALEDLIVGEI